MASQVLSGVSNPTYTNNTGQNVRLILSFMNNVTSVSWAGVTANLSNFKRDYPTFRGVDGTSQIQSFSNLLLSMFPPFSDDAGTRRVQQVGNFKMAHPHQLTLAPGETFSAVCGPYNIIVIKEDGT